MRTPGTAVSHPAVKPDKQTWVDQVLTKLHNNTSCSTTHLLQQRLVIQQLYRQQQYRLYCHEGHHQVTTPHVAHTQAPGIHPLLPRQLPAAGAHQPQRARLVGAVGATWRGGGGGRRG
jgi:hypothetical protein